MVRKKGLEPSRPLGHMHLKHACLPIPPLAQVEADYTSGPGMLGKKISPDERGSSCLPDVWSVKNRLLDRAANRGNEAYLQRKYSPFLREFTKNPYK